MRRYLFGLALFAVLAMALCDAIWPARPELMIEAQLRSPVQEQLLFAPCPLGPANVPPPPPKERTA